MLSICSRHGSPLPVYVRPYVRKDRLMMVSWRQFAGCNVFADRSCFKCRLSWLNGTGHQRWHHQPVHCGWITDSALNPTVSFAWCQGAIVQSVTKYARSKKPLSKKRHTKSGHDGRDFYTWSVQHIMKSRVQSVWSRSVGVYENEAANRLYSSPSQSS